jgi:hypothetical protein
MRLVIDTNVLVSYRAAVTRCQVGVSPASSQTVAQMQGDVHQRWLVWWRTARFLQQFDGLL